MRVKSLFLLTLILGLSSSLSICLYLYIYLSVFFFLFPFLLRSRFFHHSVSSLSVPLLSPLNTSTLSQVPHSIFSPLSSSSLSMDPLSHTGPSLFFFLLSAPLLPHHKTNIIHPSYPFLHFLGVSPTSHSLPSSVKRMEVK